VSELNAATRETSQSTSTGQLRCAVIGAGPSGLAAARNFSAIGANVTVFERHTDLGGNWCLDSPHSSVLPSTHLISSKRITEFTDFPMPDSWPAYPRQSQVMEYFRSYAEHFDLRRLIRFGTAVVRAEPRTRGWSLEVAGANGDGSSREDFDLLVVASGHHWDPLWPEISQDFAGEKIHSHHYKSPSQLAGKRVLVVGAGNSGCDIAVEASTVAQAVTLSLRRGYHFLPKFLFGKPADECAQRLHRWSLPLVLRRWVASVVLYASVGPLKRYGLPSPDHRLFETHPIVNSQLLYHVGHGRVAVAGDVKAFRGNTAIFADGSEREFDTVVFATGYRITMPFLDRSWWQDDAGQLILHLNAFHPQRDDLVFVGLVQPDGGIWCLSDLQTKIAAAYWKAKTTNSRNVRWFTQQCQQGPVEVSGGIRYIASPRHLLEVQYYAYRRRLEHLLRRLGG
jgi:cation diffusion facilitator CzcD-associated flavoprotein CzcO